MTPTKVMFVLETSEDRLKNLELHLPPVAVTILRDLVTVCKEQQKQINRLNKLVPDSDGK